MAAAAVNFMRTALLAGMLVLGLLVAAPSVTAEDIDDGEVCVSYEMVEACVASQILEELVPGPCTCPPRPDYW